ncbi:hypothetical protein OL548_17865 [Lysinibacillus sp. MHQ-1]|nr:hypothetical protein OL548_17865 [Lysinibacillus sp. MHQ-1]
MRDDITVIDDTVHSHPQGVRAAIDVLTNIAKKKKSSDYWTNAGAWGVEGRRISEGWRVYL